MIKNKHTLAIHPGFCHPSVSNGSSPMSNVASVSNASTGIELLIDLASVSGIYSGITGLDIVVRVVAVI